MEVFFMQCTLLLTEMKKLMKNCPFEKKRSLNRRLAFEYTGQREKIERKGCFIMDLRCCERKVLK